MDLRRLVFPPLANVNDFMQAGHGITNEFSGCPYHLPDGDNLTCIDDVQKSIRAKSFDEVENADLCVLAAKHGRVNWTFKPMADNENHNLFTHWRKQVPNVDPDGWRRERAGSFDFPSTFPGMGNAQSPLRIRWIERGWRMRTYRPQVTKPIPADAVIDRVKGIVTYRAKGKTVGRS